MVRPALTTAQRLYELWLAAGYVGGWSTKEWVQANNGIKLLNGSEADALTSFQGFLLERAEFYSGHYPSKWAREPAKWLRKSAASPRKLTPEETLALVRQRYAARRQEQGPERGGEPKALSEIAKNVGHLRKLLGRGGV